MADPTPLLGVPANAPRSPRPAARGAFPRPDLDVIRRAEGDLSPIVLGDRLRIEARADAIFAAWVEPAPRLPVRDRSLYGRHAEEVVDLTRPHPLPSWRRIALTLLLGALVAAGAVWLLSEMAQALAEAVALNAEVEFHG